MLTPKGMKLMRVGNIKHRNLEHPLRNRPSRLVTLSLCGRNWTGHLDNRYAA
uniref:Uncharacterized protein n=1 Tax=Nelumbo nucifera TaxID=4432 RepID=A0A822YS20_NELNU|nr:TPA_asm: hypothetical protein HUJ06_006092 [Nelumbo nucifera]